MNTDLESVVISKHQTGLVYMLFSSFGLMGL